MRRKLHAQTSPTSSPSLDHAIKPTICSDRDEFKHKYIWSKATHTNAQADNDEQVE